MSLSDLKIYYTDVLKQEYGFTDVISLTTLPGGYLEEETWLVRLNSNDRYVMKTIHYPFSDDHLETILTFQNHLCSNLNYPCPRIVLTLMSKLFIQIKTDHYIFVQTFIDGHIPNLTELDEYYLMEMGKLFGQWHMVSQSFIEKTSTYNINRTMLTDEWWIEQFNHLSHCEHFQTIDIEYLRSILLEGQQKISPHIVKWKQGLIHGDFQTSNTLYTPTDRMVYAIDFGEVTYAPFIVDVATTLFLFLTNGVEDEKRLRVFLSSYQESSAPFDPDDIDLIDLLVRVKLTTNFIQDCMDIESQRDYDQSEWLQTCIKWIYLLQEQKQYLFRSILLNE